MLHKIFGCTLNILLIEDYSIKIICIVFKINNIYYFFYIKTWMSNFQNIEKQCYFFLLFFVIEQNTFSNRRLKFLWVSPNTIKQILHTILRRFLLSSVYHIRRTRIRIAKMFDFLFLMYLHVLGFNGLYKFPICLFACLFICLCVTQISWACYNRNWWTNLHEFLCLVTS